MKARGRVFERAREEIDAPARESERETEREEESGKFNRKRPRLLLSPDETPPLVNVGRIKTPSKENGSVSVLMQCCAVTPMHGPRAQSRRIISFSLFFCPPIDTQRFSPSSSSRVLYISVITRRETK